MIQTALIAVLAALGCGLGGFLYGVGVGEDREVSKQAALEVVAENAAAKVADTMVTAVNNIKAQRSVVYQKATHEIKTVPVYTDCRHSDGVYDAINEAITGRRAVSGSPTSLPQADTTGRP